jgi:transposase
MNVTTVGVDLAKNVFACCVADAVGRVIELREFNRGGFLSWLTTLLQGTVVAMEACGGAHNWGRTMGALGLKPRLNVLTHRFAIQPGALCDRRDAQAFPMQFKNHH